MKYQATYADGKAILDDEGRPIAFDSEQACLEFERAHQRDEKLKEEAARYLDLQDWPENSRAAKRERTKAERWIHGWLAHDARQRPERYGTREDMDSEAAAVELAEATG